MEDFARRSKSTSRDALVFPIKNPKDWFKPAMEDAKIINYRWRDNRHTFCSRLAMRGENLKVIRQLAGHKTIQMSMGPDVKHLRASVALAEERNFTRAASRVRLGQPGLTKQILALEDFLGYPRSIRDVRRVDVTPTGEVFVAEAKSALQHLDRAKIALQGAEAVLHVGKTPYTNPFFDEALLFALTACSRCPLRNVE